MEVHLQYDAITKAQLTKDTGSLSAFCIICLLKLGSKSAPSSFGRGPSHIKYTDLQLWQRRPDRKLQVAY